MGNRSVLVSRAVGHSFHRWFSLANHIHTEHRQYAHSVLRHQNENEKKNQFVKNETIKQKKRNDASSSFFACHFRIIIMENEIQIVSNTHKS